MWGGVSLQPTLCKARTVSLTYGHGEEVSRGMWENLAGYACTRLGLVGDTLLGKKVSV